MKDPNLLISVAAFVIHFAFGFLDFIQTGGKKAEAARRFSVNRSTI